MKSLGHKRGGGNINLRGKLLRLLDCRCCAMFNRKGKMKERDDQREMRDARASVRVSTSDS
jgi:hypothetical protein